MIKELFKGKAAIGTVIFIVGLTALIIANWGDIVARFK